MWWLIIMGKAHLSVLTKPIMDFIKNNSMYWLLIITIMNFAMNSSMYWLWTLYRAKELHGGQLRLGLRTQEEPQHGSFPKSGLRIEEQPQWVSFHMVKNVFNFVDLRSIRNLLRKNVPYTFIWSLIKNGILEVLYRVHRGQLYMLTCAYEKNYFKQ